LSYGKKALCKGDVQKLLSIKLDQGMNDEDRDKAVRILQIGSVLPDEIDVLDKFIETGEKTEEVEIIFDRHPII
jgi:hypothetical protein